MKNSLLVLGLSTLAQLGFAEMSSDRPMQNSNDYRNDACCPCVCCNSCQKDINCECYTPKYYDLKCDCGMFIAADFLYWYGRDTKLPYAEKTKSILLEDNNGAVTLYAATNSFKYMKAAWDPGVRVALGFNSECDGWDYVATWTYYRNTRKDSSSVDAFDCAAPGEDAFGLVDRWDNDLGFSDNGFFFEKISARYKMKLNQLDVEIGRRYWLSKCFTMRPYFGARGLWTETDFRTKATNPNSQAIGLVNQAYNKKNKFNNTFSGGGIVGGFQPNWYWTPCFSLYGNLDMSLLWGDFRDRKKENYVIDTLDSGGDVDSTLLWVPSRSNSPVSSMLPILDLGIGFRYENTYCDCQYRFSLDLGWEHHVLFNHNRRYQIVTQESVSNLAATGSETVRFSTKSITCHDTVFGGFVLRARFDF